MSLLRPSTPGTTTLQLAGHRGTARHHNPVLFYDLHLPKRHDLVAAGGAWMMATALHVARCMMQRLQRMAYPTGAVRLFEASPRCEEKKR
jgi:hypothetical protein